MERLTLSCGCLILGVGAMIFFTITTITLFNIIGNLYVVGVITAIPLILVAILSNKFVNNLFDDKKENRKWKTIKKLLVL